MSKTCILTAATLFCWGAAAAATEVSVSAEGSGGVSRSGQTPSAVTKAELSLKPDGQFIITLSGDERHQFRGSWQELSDDRISLTLSQAFGAAAGGQGVLMLRRGRVNRLGLGGDNDAFSASFRVTGRYTDFVNPANSSDAAATSGGVRAPRPGRERPQPAPDQAASSGRIRAPRPVSRPRTAPAPPPPPAPRATSGPFRKTVEGAGTFSVAEAEGDDRQVTAMEVFLNDDQSLHLKMFGPGFSSVIGGVWRKTGAGPAGTTRYRLTVRSGFGAGQTSGSGTLLAGDGRVVALSVNGSATALRSDWRLEFRQR